MLGIQMSGSIVLSLGFKNTKSGVGGANEDWENLDDVGYYPSLGGKYYKFSTNYYTHDWIADSAIRLIMRSSYKDQIKWLFDDSVDLSKFDAEENGMFNGDYWSDTDLERARWLHTRRYIYFLVGSSVPDRNVHNIIISDYSDAFPYPVPAEKVRLPIEWGTVRVSAISKHLHSVFYKKDENLRNRPYSPTLSTGALKAQLAGEDAIKLLKNKKKNDEGELVSSPKFEAAAIAIGGMAHYIGDLAHFAHARYPDESDLGVQWKNSGRSHKLLDLYVADDGVTNRLDNLDPLTGQGIGGPDWSVINPGDLYITNSDGVIVKLVDETNQVSGLRPKAPFLAALDMAWLTFSGRDPENGGDNPDDYDKGYGSRGGDLGKSSGLYLPTLDKDLDDASFNTVTKFYDGIAEARAAVQARVKTLVKWAAFYTACAILYILDKAKVNDDTTTDRLALIQNPDVPHQDPPVFDDILDDYKQKFTKVRGRENTYRYTEIIGNLSVSLAVIIPVMGLVILPSLAKAAKEGGNEYNTDEDFVSLTNPGIPVKN